MAALPPSMLLHVLKPKALEAPRKVGSDTHSTEQRTTTLDPDFGIQTLRHHSCFVFRLRNSYPFDWTRSSLEGVLHCGLASRSFWLRAGSRGRRKYKSPQLHLHAMPHESQLPLTFKTPPRPRRQETTLSPPHKFPNSNRPLQA